MSLAFNAFFGGGIMMDSMISIDEKKEFLKWFLNSFQLKRRECAWLLNYLISDDRLMEKIHFVDGAKFCPKGIVISTIDVDKIPFCYYRHKHITMDAEKAFHDIRLNDHEEVYIQLNFPNASTNFQYAAVLEENPFMEKNTNLNIADKIIAELFLDKMIEKAKMEYLKKQIDKALDLRNEELFHQLVKKLNGFHR